MAPSRLKAHGQATDSKQLAAVAFRGATNTAILPAVAMTSKLLGARGVAQARSLNIDAGRIPPGQCLTSRFPVLTYGPNPDFDLGEWSLRIWGEVQTPLTLSWEQLMAMEQVECHCDIHCVTRWSKLDTSWIGVRVRDVLALAAPTPTGKFVMAHCDGDYTTNLPLEALLDDDVIFAHTYDAKPLEPDHGAPLRLLVPKRYLWKSAKFLRGLEVMSEDRQGFWELNGYHNDADPWTEQRTWF